MYISNLSRACTCSKLARQPQYDDFSGANYRVFKFSLFFVATCLKGTILDTQCPHCKLAKILIKLLKYRLVAIFCAVKE